MSPGFLNPTSVENNPIKILWMILNTSYFILNITGDGMAALASLGILVYTHTIFS